jgi:hypothetical protein
MDSTTFLTCHPNSQSSASAAKCSLSTPLSWSISPRAGLGRTECLILVHQVLSDVGLDTASGGVLLTTANLVPIPAKQVLHRCLLNNLRQKWHDMTKDS